MNMKNHVMNKLCDQSRSKIGNQASYEIWNQIIDKQLIKVENQIWDILWTSVWSYIS